MREKKAQHVQVSSIAIYGINTNTWIKLHTCVSSKGLHLSIPSPSRPNLKMPIQVLILMILLLKNKLLVYNFSEILLVHVYYGRLTYKSSPKQVHFRASEHVPITRQSKHAIRHVCIRYAFVMHSLCFFFPCTYITSQLKSHTCIHVCIVTRTHTHTSIHECIRSICHESLAK